MSLEHLNNIKELEKIIMERVRNLNDFECELESKIRKLDVILKAYDSLLHRNI